jgi:acetylornithine deacetylase
VSLLAVGENRRRASACDNPRRPFDCSGHYSAFMPPHTPLDLALSLMSVDSTSGREGEVIALTEQLLRAGGWMTTRIAAGPGRDALLARSVENPRVTLSTHLDTVPPYLPAQVSGDTLRGRGACDAKGIAASMIVAAERLRARALDVALLFVVGEETTHDGATAANEWAKAHLPPTPRALINGEPTESTLALGTKGAMRFDVRTAGRAAHSAYPELGSSAITKLVRLLAELDTVALPHDPALGATTINIGCIRGGVADNVIAPAAEARLMARLVTPAEELWGILERWIAGRATLEQGVTVPVVRLAAVDGFPTSVAAFATDIPSLGAWGTPYLFGPGSIHVAHTPDEWVSIAELDRAVDAYERLAVAALEALPRGSDSAWGQTRPRV